MFLTQHTTGDSIQVKKYSNKLKKLSSVRSLLFSHFEVETYNDHHEGVAIGPLQERTEEPTMTSRTVQQVKKENNDMPFRTPVKKPGEAKKKQLLKMRSWFFRSFTPTVVPRFGQFLLPSLY